MAGNRYRSNCDFGSIVPELDLSKVAIDPTEQEWGAVIDRHWIRIIHT